MNKQERNNRETERQMRRFLRRVAEYVTWVNFADLGFADEPRLIERADVQAAIQERISADELFLQHEVWLATHRLYYDQFRRILRGNCSEFEKAELVQRDPTATGQRRVTRANDGQLAMSW